MNTYKMKKGGRIPARSAGGDPAIQRSRDPAIQKRTLHCSHKLIDDLVQMKDPHNGATC